MLGYPDSPTRLRHEYEDGITFVDVGFIDGTGAAKITPLEHLQQGGK